MNYKAFISYSHAADGRLAPTLQAALHRFAKKWYQLRAVRVFRDKSSLAVAPALWGSIRSALVDSEFFLLLASPDASASEWVRREITTWLDKEGNSDRLLIVLTDGGMKWDDATNEFDWEVTTALPEETLRGRFEDEPLYVDLRWARTATHLSLANSRFKDEVAGIAATLHGRPKDELMGDDVREHKKTIRLAWSAIIALLLLSVGVGVAAVVASQQRDAARRFLGRVQTASGLRLVKEGDTWGGLIWLAEALRWDSSNDAREREHRVRLGSHLRNLPALAQVLKHEQPVNTAEFSPDGTRLVTAAGAVYDREGPQGAARVWEALTGQLVTGELRHAGAVYSASFSPDGHRIVTAGGDKTARVWDAATGEALLSLAHEKLVRRAYFSPDGRRIVTAAGMVRVWDAANGKLLAETGEQDWNIWYATFSPDGSRVLALMANPYRDDNAFALVWDPRADKVVRLPMRGHWGYHGSFSPDGTCVVTANVKGAQVWDAATGQPIGTPMKHDDRVVQASFSPAGELVLTAGWDGTARLWRAASGEPLTREGQKAGEKIPLVLHHGGQIKYATFSPDGRKVATASTDGTLRVWDAASGTVLTDPLPFSHFDYPAGKGGLVGDTSPGAEFCVRFSPDGGRLAAAGWDGTARIWDLNPVGCVVGPTPLQEAPAAKNDFVPPLKFFGFLARAAPRVVVANTREATVRVRDPLSGRIVGTPPKLDKPAGEAVLSPDGRRLATLRSTAGTVAAVWDAETGRPTVPPLEHEYYLAFAKGRHLTFSPDSRWLATISNGHSKDDTGQTTDIGVVHLWDVGSGKLAIPLMEHGAWVSDVAFDAAGRRLATARELIVTSDGVVGGTVRLWDTKTGVLMRPELSHRTTVTRVWFTPDDRRIVTLEGFDTQVINVWDLATGELETKIAHAAGGVNAVAFSSDSRKVATAGTEQAARVWDLESGDPVTPWLRHEGNAKASLLLPTGLTSVGFSPDSLQLVTGSVDTTLRVWQVENGLPLTPFIRHGEPIQELAFDSTGSRVLVLGVGGIFSAWTVVPDDRPIEELVHLTQLLGVRRLDETGSLVGLEFDAFLQLWTEYAGAQRRRARPANQTRSIKSGN